LPITGTEFSYQRTQRM